MDTEVPKEEYFVQFSGKVYLEQPGKFERGQDYVFVVKAECRGLKGALNRDDEPESVTLLKIYECKQA